MKCYTDTFCPLVFLCLRLLKKKTVDVKKVTFNKTKKWKIRVESGIEYKNEVIFELDHWKCIFDYNS